MTATPDAPTAPTTDAYEPEVINNLSDDALGEIAAEAETAKRLSLVDPMWAELLRPFVGRDIGIMAVDFGGEGSRAECKRGNNVSRDGLYCGENHGQSRHVKFVGHAAIERRLLEVVGPEGYSVKPANRALNHANIKTLAEAGLADQAKEAHDNAPPEMDEHGGVWVVLDVMGEKRHGYGFCRNVSSKMKPGDRIKAAQSDAFKNAAMRLGLGLDLWLSKDVSGLNGQRVHDGPTADPKQVRAAVLAAFGDDDPADTIRQIRQYDRENGISWDGVHCANEFGMREEMETWAARVRQQAMQGIVIKDWTDANRSTGESIAGPVSARVRQQAQAAARASQAPASAPEVAEVAPQAQEPSTAPQAPASDAPALAAAESWYDEWAWQSMVLGENVLRLPAPRWLRMHGITGGRVQDLPVERLADMVKKSRQKVVDTGLFVDERPYLTSPGPVRLP